MPDRVSPNIGTHTWFTAMHEKKLRRHAISPSASAPTLFGSITSSPGQGPYGVFPVNDLIAGTSSLTPYGTGIAVVGEFTFLAGNYLGMVVAGFPLGNAAIPVLGSTATMTMRKVRDGTGATVSAATASTTFTGTIPLDGTDVPYTTFTTTADVGQGAGGHSTQFQMTNAGTYYVEFWLAP